MEISGWQEFSALPLQLFCKSKVILFLKIFGVVVDRFLSLYWICYIIAPAV